MSTTPNAKVWLITGSNRGFGRALAEALLEHGDRLVATSRRPEQLSDLITRYDEQVRTVALDVTHVEQAHAAVATAMEAFGRLDVVGRNNTSGRATGIRCSPRRWYVNAPSRRVSTYSSCRRGNLTPWLW
jgi:NAD(P)-dependent dehydrogenase (short-subunit alcohol dehydrogenase family)